MIDIINIGELDRYVQIYQKSISRDTTFNQPQESWSLLGSFWGKRIMSKGGEKIEDDKIQAIRKRGYFMQWESELNAVNEEDRIVDDGEVWEIVSAEIARVEGYVIFECEYRVT